MKKTILVLISLFFSFFVIAQDDEDIKGYWLTEEGTSQIYIYKAKNGNYYGKIVWLEEPYENGAPKKDKENPEPELQTRPLLDLLMLRGFEFDASDREWENGTIYDPKSGKTYDCYIWFENGNKRELKIKGFVMGMRFLGRETTWKRSAPKNT